MQYINLHTHQFKNNSNYIEIVNQYPNEFSSEIPLYSSGIHPWYIDEDNWGKDLNILKEILSKKQCIALGECGLDNRIDKNYSLQKEVFEAQLELIKNNPKPVIIHCVGYFNELIQIKNKHQLPNPFIIHGFSKSKELAHQLLKNDCYISFGKYLIRNPKLHDVFKEIPLDRIFLETDTLEESIEEVYELAAKLKNISLEELKSIIWCNFETVFKK